MKRCISLCILLSFCAMVPVARADSQGQSLVIASIENLPPFVYMEDGKLTGISIDIVTELARRAGFEARIRTFPWARVLQELQAGNVDGAFSLYETEERKGYCLYTGIFHYDELRIATRYDRQFDFSGIGSLYGKEIGKGRDVFVSEAFDAAVRDGKITVSEVNDMDMSNIRKLHAGRVDAVIGSPAAMMNYAHRLGIQQDIVLLPKPLRKRIPAYFVLSGRSALKDKQEWQRRITSVLAGMDSDGTIRAINERYGYALQ